MELQGKVVLVTGGGRGIGREIALGCAKAGALVAVVARSQSDLAETLSLLKPLCPKALAISADVAKADDVERIFSQVKQALGPVYGLVSAAAIHGPIGPFESLDPEDFLQVLQVNVMGTVRCAQAAIAQMESGGRLVFFSGGGEKAFPRFSSYVASKGAIWRLTETLGAELKDQKIFVNAIAPGAVNTKLLTNVLDAGPELAGAENYAASVKQSEEGGTSPDKAVRLALFLLSPRSYGLTGKVLSAVWDDYDHWKDLEKISNTDWYNVRRVKPEVKT